MSYDNFHNPKFIVHLIIKVFKIHPLSPGFCYKLKIKGRKATITEFAPIGLAPDFTKAVKLLMQSE